MESTRRFLEKKLRLQINEEKSSVTTPGKVHFLGFRFKLQSNNRVAVLLSAKTKAKLLDKIGELTPRSWGQSLRNCFEKINEYFRGWIGHFRICTEEGASEFRRYDAHLQRRLRAIIIHQKKRARFLYRHLLQRGANPRQAAGTAYSRRGIWHRSNRTGINVAYSNTWFATQWTSSYDLWCIANPPAEVSDQLSLAF
jgi:hypothetical protein